MLRDFTKFGGGGEVVYCDDLPKIHPNEEFIDSAIKNIYSKLRKWHFEEEYRTHKLNLTAINNDWRKVTIEADVFKEIILGANIEKDDYEEIIRIRDRNFPNTKILQAELVRNNIIFTVIKN
jgi:mRNA-degrading endonuclease YafQ of YafQ-DinJ toxin-antitoxin module